MVIGLTWNLFIIASLNIPLNGTHALFTDQTKVKVSLETGSWFDNSSLTFTSTGKDTNEINAYIKNEGPEDMIRDSKYYVYYSQNGNPVSPRGETGELVFQGVIPRMAATDDPIRLTHIPQKKGFYMFVAFQNHEKPIGMDLIIEGSPVTVSKKSMLIIKRR